MKRRSFLKYAGGASVSSVRASWIAGSPWAAVSIGSVSWESPLAPTPAAS